MKKYYLGKNLAALTVAWALLVMPIVSIGQTRISMPKNKYRVQEDVKIGREAAMQVNRQFPLLNDSETQRYVETVGERLVSAIPAQFRQPEFDYSFKVVNASDINAFALPGGPMYVNRGMIQAARNEGEMAGVMAHEISHVALRHATAQQTKLSSPGNQILGIGAILGGAILGGQTGAAIGQTIVGAAFTRYSREYETQADILGSQIMANAGYDPRDLANMFRTIEQQSGGSRAPEWLSSHPNPGNRYNSINREAQMLRVNNPIRNSAQFERVQSRLTGFPRAQSMEEISRNPQYGSGQAGSNPTAGGRYSSRVQYPSSRTQVYRSGNWIQLNVPNNWRSFESQGSVQFAPEGAYGDSGITHGVMIGVAQTNGNNLRQAADQYVNGVLQSNNYLRQSSNYSQTSLGNRQALATVLSGRSPITGRNEVVTIYTTQLRDGSLFYVAMVAPEQEASSYNNAFRNIVRSLRLND